MIEFHSNKRAVSIEETPLHPKSDDAVPSLYIHDDEVEEYAKTIKPSNRGELEITDINQIYLQNNELNVSIFNRGTAWLDTGTFHSLMQAGQFVQVIEDRQGLKIGAIEEVAYRMGYINRAELHQLAKPLCKSGYGEYLMRIV